MGTHISSESPESAKSRVEHLSKMLEILRSGDTVLLMTRSEQGAIAGRPMALVEVDDDGTIYLTTSIGSQKAIEIAADPQVNVSVQTGKGIVTIEAEARLSQERAIIDQLWKDSWRLWYPEGRHSPSIAIIVVSPVEGTYWDTSLSHGLSFLYRAVKAKLTGEAIETNASDVGSVQLRQ